MITLDNFRHFPWTIITDNETILMPQEGINHIICDIGKDAIICPMKLNVFEKNYLQYNIDVQEKNIVMWLDTLE